MKGRKCRGSAEKSAGDLKRRRKLGEVYLGGVEVEKEVAAETKLDGFFASAKVQRGTDCMTKRYLSTYDQQYDDNQSSTTKNFSTTLRFFPYSQIVYRYTPNNPNFSSS